MAPVIKDTREEPVVLARRVRNRRLADALYLQAFSALINSPGRRAYYDAPLGPMATPTTKL